MARTLFRTTLALLLVAAVLEAPAWGSDAQHHKLKNGVTVITMPAKWNQIVAVSVTVDAGAKHDPPKLAGLARITASLMTQSTTARSAPELAELIDRNALQLGSETTQDYAHIYVTAIDSQFDLALEVITDVLQRPAFEEKRLLEAQRLAHAYIDERESDPLYTALSQVEETLYADHPYALPAYGTSEGIDRITTKHLVKFHTSRYFGEGTVICIVGDFEVKPALRRLEELLSDYPSTGGPGIAPPQMELSGSRISKLSKDVDNAQVALGFFAPSAGHPDFITMAVVEALLGIGRGARLPMALGEEGSNVAESTGAYCRCRTDGSALVVYAVGEDLALLRNGLLSEIERIRTEPVPDEELTFAKNRMIGRHVINGQTNLVRAARIASYELAGLGFDFESRFLDAVMHVDKDDVMRVASEWLREPATALVLPGKSARPERAKRTGI